MKYIFTGLLLFILINNSPLRAQEKERKWELNGYVKDLRALYFFDGLDSVLVDNLLHNRLNFRWYAHEHFTVKLELRNRIFYGELVRQFPDFGKLPDTNNDFFDLSFNIIDANSLVFNTTIDRGYIEYNKNDWEVRVGRQRINWGINLAWNPNDIFNAYSFFDFDYEERPGSDAVRIKKYTGIASSIEVAANIADDSDDWVLAGLWKTNKWNYDFQLLAGKARQDFVLGAGWAGSIYNAGFKGEVTWFKPFDDSRQDTFETWLLSISADYSFSGGLYLNGSFLINTGLESGLGTDTFNTLSADRLDTKSVLPYPYATFLQSNYTINPLLTMGVSWMTFPGEEAFFINPVLTASVFSNVDLDVIGQIFYEKKEQGYRSDSPALFLRVKWSF
ncbi:hypothetical protein QQ020_19375 [Fulvivirgaceae bacterium BMA12]|uniref:Porin n=1 Tax=Agaribacillus aureus TaxID=3051825 RepID=A0ABT8LD56_9BACT|nr:hypothetical protein [Fulvivirgaceae bacterium BMA12]